MIKLCTIWLLGNLISANRQTLVEEHPHVLYDVCQYTYTVDGGTIYTTSTVYDSLIVRRDSNLLTMQYYLDNTELKREVKLEVADTVEKGMLAPTATAHLNMWYEKMTIDPITFPLVVREFTSCPDPFCSTRHGHIQYTNKSWYSTEFGPLISSGGNYWRNSSVTVLMGYKDDLFAGRLVGKLMHTYFQADKLLYQKYQADSKNYRNTSSTVRF